jgi:MFS family permease
MELEPSLERWVEAQILDRPQADRIRQFESEQLPRRRARWPVIAAVAFGGIMLASGVLLFVSAHWDEISPFQRMALLVLAVGAFHVGGALSLERFRAVGVTLHAVGTVALGGAIAVAGQIFNMQEHWPAAVLLWAAGAIAGWLVLRDWPHLALAAILVPFWLAGEWVEAAPGGRDFVPVLTCGILLLAVCYLSVRLPGADNRQDHVRTALTWLGGLALLPATLAVAIAPHAFRSAPDTGIGMLAFGWACAILLPLGFAYAFRRNAAWMNLVAALWVIGLNFMAEPHQEILLYGWCAIGAAAMVAWGIYEFRAERINLGMAGFAVTIIFFFFSSVMDKLGRSASLMALGILFVGGGWFGEKLRRKLVAGLVSGGVQ